MAKLSVDEHRLCTLVKARTSRKPGACCGPQIAGMPQELLRSHLAKPPSASPCAKSVCKGGRAGVSERQYADLSLPRRRRKDEELATLRADGASVHLVCSDAPSNATVVATAANVHVQLLLAERRPRVGIASSRCLLRQEAACAACRRHGRE